MHQLVFNILIDFKCCLDSFVFNLDQLSIITGFLGFTIPAFCTSGFFFFFFGNIPTFC